ncbi:hypothetical protein Ahy_A10g050249 [Arachis hypogaea]|uniref:Uncharacterized protein n=1 Tax=Arachis hypogaea TaxID=3818 RepID=A0A445B8X2_ARAHY|nr:hypothetical protein Ahy_A10g050249 [Arachis hypogaea]
MIGYSDSGKDVGRLSAIWALYKAQEELIKVAKNVSGYVNIVYITYSMMSARYLDKHHMIVSLILLLFI